MTVTKSILYRFLRVKKLEVIQAQLNPLRDKAASLAEEARLKTLKDHGFDLTQLSRQFLDFLELCTELHEISSDWGSLPSRVLNNLNSCNSLDAMRDQLLRDVVYEVTGEILDLRVEIQSVRERIDFQFEQLNAVVKSCSAKRGLEFLTEAGFDTSGLDLSVKHEVMTLEVDKDLLGLPEGDKK